MQQEIKQYFSSHGMLSLIALGGGEPDTNLSHIRHNNSEKEGTPND